MELLYFLIYFGIIMKQSIFTQIVLVVFPVVLVCFFRVNGRWPQHWAALGRLQDLTFLEMFPVVTALAVWGPLLANKRILFHIDNQSVVHIIDKQTSKSPDVMVLVRRFVIKTLTFNIIFRAEYISTKLNAIADSISRCQWSRFRALAPQADLAPTPLPQEIWNI